MCLALASASALASEGGVGFQLLAPRDGAVVRAPEILLVYTLSPGVEVLYQLDGNPTRLQDTPVPGDDADLRHVRVQLEEGRHRIRLVQAADEAEIGSLTVTYVPPFSRRTANAPGDRAYAFHTQAREATCAGCHSLPEVFETVPDRPLAPAGKVCRACHPGVEAPPHLHGPVAVYACFMCHEPEYSPARFGQKTSQPASCGVCHEGFLARVLGGKKFVHGPVAAGGCLVCHDPHGGETATLLREVPPALCLRCHADTLPLPVRRNLHGTVPCTRCHDPHGGRTVELTAAEGNDFCGTCHPDVAQAIKGHPVPGHPVSASIDPARPGRPMGCPSCHGAHSPNDVSRLSAGDDVARKRFCRRCHY